MGHYVVVADNGNKYERAVAKKTARATNIIVTLA